MCDNLVISVDHALVTSGLEENTLELVEKFSCHRLVIQSQNYQNIVYTIDSWGAIITNR